MKHSYFISSQTLTHNLTYYSLRVYYLSLNSKQIYFDLLICN